MESQHCIVGVDPTRSMGWRDSLLNEKKMWVDFRVLENSSPRRNGFALELPLNFCFYFIKGKNKYEQKNPYDSSMEKVVCEKLDSRFGDQVTYREGTSYEVAPL